MDYIVYIVLSIVLLLHSVSYCNHLTIKYHQIIVGKILKDCGIHFLNIIALHGFSLQQKIINVDNLM